MSILVGCFSILARALGSMERSSLVHRTPSTYKTLLWVLNVYYLVWCLRSESNPNSNNGGVLSTSVILRVKSEKEGEEYGFNDSV